MSKSTGLGRRALWCLAGLGLSMFLSACGGGGGGSAGTPVLGGGPGGGTVPSSLGDLVVVLSKSSISNAGGDTVDVTVTSVDGNRQSLAGAPISFAINSDAVITSAGTTTGADGTLKATASMGSNASPRSITLKVASGSISKDVSFDVVQAPTSGTPKAADISLELSATNIDNSGSKTVGVTVTAVDAARNALSGIPVVMSISSGYLTGAATQTDSTGQVKATANIGADHANRQITVTATSGTLVKTRAFQVTGASLTGTAVPALPVAGSANNKIEYLLTDVNKNPMPDVDITVSGAGLPTVNAKTTSNGAYFYYYTAPATPGAVEVTALAGGASSKVTITVPSGTSTVPAVNTTVSSASVTTSPSVVQVNTSATSNRTELRALFLGANNVPIKNVRVRFDLNGDANSVGGTISAGSSIVYSDDGGNAITSYSPSTRSSPTNGVTVRACWDYADFAVGQCPNSTTTTLTVVDTPVSISIGTDNTISDGASLLTYVKKYVVLVVDSAGNPKSDVQITPSLDLNAYYKGYYLWSPIALSDVLKHDTEISSAVDGLATKCTAEDTNRNGSIDAGEDRNGNGQLDPRKSDVSVSLVGATRTDSSGIAVVQIEYPKSFAGWIQFQLSVSASGVISPPAVYDGILPVLASALKTESPPPAFQYSPFGTKRLTTDVTGYCSNKD
ncbi:MAG TPA: hypothetical protein VGE47_08935 [Burkholderiaceae bacterium]